MGKASKIEVKRTLSIVELTGILSDQILRITNDETSAAVVNAVSNATGKILSSVKLQMEYQKLTGRKMDIPLLSGEDE